ncbi:hypothetical protein [Neolewinella antarctica]|uniref:Uncharacterized protein n=1 Tax=Neolewinella antarctica TaxID=442734 RepID=A0ABX0XBZ8_9BACT|nr:hypothetical protein [Neolewinella antarctica]NJC26458.1 hypothetical protein [Neolewinella antarctica]
MTLDKLLDEFYLTNGIPQDGGIEDDTFQMKVFFVILTLPNPVFRKELTHIHDIQHVLNDCDTSWRGEGFISGWEVGTEFWKRFPINIFILWAFGYSLWLHPAAVHGGFKKGLNSVGVVDLGISKEDFMNMELDRLVELTTSPRRTEMGAWQWAQFLWWCLVSQVILLFPIAILIAGISWLINL